MQFTIATFSEGPLKRGDYSFPFAMHVPSWLPSSLALNCGENSKVCIRYFIRAQFTPKKKTDFVVPGVSVFRGERMIFLYSQPKVFPTRNLDFNITNKVGGLFGVGKSQSSCDFIFEKNEFYAGEEARVRIICDNTKCGKAVKSFKFKISREFVGRTGNKKHSIE